MLLLRRLAFRLLLCLAAAMPAAAAASTVELTLLEAVPAPEVVLVRDQELYLRIGYRSDREILFVATGMAAGKPLAGRNGSSPRYQPGAGEALFWFSADRPVTIDAVRIAAVSADGEELAVVTAPLNRRWDPAAEFTEKPLPAWVAQLETERALLVKRFPLKKNTVGPVPGVVGTWVFPLSALGYLVLQIFAWRRFPGRWRIAGLLPAGAMLTMLGVAATAFLAGLKPWSAIPIMVTPAIFAWLAVTAVAWWLAGRPQPDGATASAPSAEV